MYCNFDDCLKVETRLTTFEQNVSVQEYMGQQTDIVAFVLLDDFGTKQENKSHMTWSNHNCINLKLASRGNPSPSGDKW
jgi:hypothetical protein